jgi:hypothetical protein
MRTFVGDDEFVQPKRNETAPRSECRFTFKNALTQPRLLEMDVKPAFRNPGISKTRRTMSRGNCTRWRLFGQVDKFRLADLHVSHLSSEGRGVPGTLGRACKSSRSGCSTRKVCLSASVPALGRTRHPFAVSGSEEPSQKIEFVFSASPETIRREPREDYLLHSVGKMRNLAVCALFILLISAVFMLPQSCILPQA